MRVRVLLFGPQADAASRSEVAVALPDGATCADLRSRLAAEVPALAKRLDASRFAVNHEFAPEDAALTEQDEVALIGMVSGG